MIKAVLFDFDHTLYDRRLALMQAVPALMKSLKEYLHPEVSGEQFFEALLYAETADGGYYNDGYRGVVTLLKEQNMFRTTPEYKLYTSMYYDAIAPAITICPDAYETLQALRDKGYKVGLLTNGHTVSQQMKLSYTQVPQYMDEIIIGDQLPQPKPHPNAFIEMCRRVGVNTDQAVYVGDHIINDVCGARGAGLIPIWKPFCQSWPQDITPPPFTIENLSDILPILDSLQEN